MPKKKIEHAASDEIRRFMAAEDWRSAILTAAKFQKLGDQRDRILSAREAYMRPHFQRQLGRDPDVLIARGVDALIERYGK